MKKAAVNRSIFKVHFGFHQVHFSSLIFCHVTSW